MAAKPSTPESASWAQFDDAVLATEFPLAVWRPDGEICLVNAALSQLVGQPGDRLIGETITIFADIFSPRPEIEATLAYLASGAVEAIRSQRTLCLPGRPPLQLWVWSRMLRIDNALMGVTAFVPVAIVDRAGSDPAALWRELADVAVGIADQQWCVVQVSADIRAILGAPASHIVGTRLRDWLHPDDPSPAEGIGPGIQSRVRVRGAAREWVPVSLVWVVDVNDPSRRFFAMVPVSAPRLPIHGDRVAELELRLRRIGAEVQAVGVLDGLGSVPGLERHPQVRELSTRQWDILSRLVNGQSAQTIARELYLSPSTVRNHLSAIYRKFGIHSQTELVRMFG